MSKKEFPILLMGICVSLICIIVIVAVVFVSMWDKTDNSPLSDVSSYTSALSDKSEVSLFESSAVTSDVLSSEPLVNGELNADFSNLILVNAKNPLPEDYDCEGNLTTIDKKYLCGNLNQMDKDAYVFVKAMLEAA